MSFSSLQIDPDLQKTIEKLGYDSPTPVQKKVIPKILERKDLRVSAPTGTGKTAAFMLPAIQLVQSPRSKGKGPRILILVPTRELAIQVASQAEKYSRGHRNINTICIYGGVPYHKQNRDLARPHDIMVATPGRLIDQLEQGRISLSRVEMFILDEADRMLDMGFSVPVKRIADALPKKRQTLLFSATLKGNVLELSNKLLNKPLEIVVYAEQKEENNIDQRLHYVDDIDHKHKILHHLLNDKDIDQAIIFTRTKRRADKLTKNLQEMDHSAAALHGDMNQRQRAKTIMRLRKGNLRFLIATDVAARGIDVRTISHVINFDLPENSEDYVHRIGRTGRAGESGISHSLATTGERSLILAIEKFTGKAMVCHVIPGLEPTGKISHQSSFRNHRSSRNNKSFSKNKSFSGNKRRRPKR